MRKLSVGLALCAGLASACAQPAENKSAATPAPDSPTSTLVPRSDFTEALPATTEVATTLAATTTTEPEPTTIPTTVFIAPTTTRRPAPTTTIYAEPSALDYGEWAIPRYIVSCETGGTFDWYAYNKSSGASGPYQLMPLHFGGELAMHQSRAAQHAKAAELWDGGRGKRHWQECL